MQGTAISPDRLAAVRSGDLKALSFTAYADTGAATNSTLAGLARLIYPAEAKELADFDVISNLPPGAPFRGPGGPPMAFALEQAIDEAAIRMKVDPITLRKRWDPNPNRQRLYDWALGLDVWRNRKNARRKRALSPRRRRRHGLLALYLAARLEDRGRGQGRAIDREHVDAGYRPGQPHRDRQHRRGSVGLEPQRSRSGSAIPICRKDRARAAAAPRRR